MLIYFGLPVQSIQQFGEAKDKGFLLTEEEAPKSTLDDDEELTTIEKAELVTKNSVQLTTEDIDEGTSDGNETWLIQHTPTKRSVGSDSETLMPLLHKKDFRKLPQWDFEDVYSRSDQPRQMVCSWISPVN